MFNMLSTKVILFYPVVRIVTLKDFLSYFLRSNPLIHFLAFDHVILFFSVIYYFYDIESS